jgi:hypothetical protein
MPLGALEAKKALVIMTVVSFGATEKTELRSAIPLVLEFAAVNTVEFKDKSSGKSI